MACKECLAGNVWEVLEYHGATKTVHGLPTYISEPPDGVPRGSIVMLPDAFGWDLPNSRYLCDVYARRTGCTVYLPDFQDGRGLPHYVMPVMNYILSPERSWIWDLPWLILAIIRAVYGYLPALFYTRESVCAPRIFAWFKAFRAHQGASLPVFTAGFCWGGLYAVRLCHGKEMTADGRALVDAAFVAHPSFLKIPTDVEKIRLPLSICLGDIDLALPVADARRLQAILEAKNEPDRFESVLLPGAKHGFAVRGQIFEEKQREFTQIAEDQAVRWFKAWLER